MKTLSQLDSICTFSNVVNKLCTDLSVTLVPKISSVNCFPGCLKPTAET